MDKLCSAIISASNVLALDYPAEAAVQNCLGFADEVILVLLRSMDETWEWGRKLARRDERVRLVESPHMPLDDQWKTRAWALGCELAEGAWLCAWDLESGVYGRYHKWLRDVMRMPTYDLLQLEMHWLYGSAHWRHREVEPRAETRFFRNDDSPRMVQAQLDLPIIHMGYARRPEAIAIGRVKAQAYQGGDNSLADGHLPHVEPYDFEMLRHVRQGHVEPYDWGEIPIEFQNWCYEHVAEWASLDAEAQIGWEGRLL